MPRSRFAALVFVGATALAGAALARSYFPGLVVGRIDKSTLRCEPTRCTARVAVERAVGFFDAGAVDGSVAEVRFSSLGEAVDRKGGETWPNPMGALPHVLDKDRIWITGALDIVDDKLVLDARLFVRVAPLPASPTPRSPMVFPACGPPPWSRAELARCYDPKTKTRAVTIVATVLGRPFADESEMPRDMRAALSVAISTVKADGVDLTPPEAHEIAYAKRAASFSGATVARPSVRALDAGDVVTLNGYYEIPLASASGPRSGFTCIAARCWPRLVVDRSIELRRGP